MLPLSLFRHRLFALTSAIGLLVNVAFYSLIFVLSLYFQQINGLSPLATGLAFLPMMGAALPANLLAARATERLGAPAIIATGATMAAVGYMALLGTDCANHFCPFSYRCTPRPCRYTPPASATRISQSEGVWCRRGHHAPCWITDVGRRR